MGCFYSKLYDNSYPRGNRAYRRPYVLSPKERLIMSEYWLISAPGDKTCQQTWETMNNVTNRQNNLSVNYKFAIPDLKVG